MKDENLEMLKKAYEATGSPMVTKQEYKLNHVLNEAFNSRHKIKGIASTNKIAEFVKDYLIRNTEI